MPGTPIDITQFHSCPDSLYWHGCYASGTYWKKYVTPESYAHPAKMSFLLCERILRHLKKLGLLNRNDTICDFMAGSGRTNTMASLHGYNSIAVELEPHFIKMIHDNTTLTKKQINRKTNTRIIQGDSRNLSSLLQEADVGIVSPPYDNRLSDNDQREFLDKENRFRRPNTSYSKPVGIVSPPFLDQNHPTGWSDEYQKKFNEQTKNKWGSYKGGQLRHKQEYSSNPQNIGNLKDKQLVGITSPPYDNRTEERHGNLPQGNPRNTFTYGPNTKNIGNQHNESYLQAMFQVYKEAAKVMPILVTITKNPTRKGILRRLDLDTCTLLQAAGYEIIDYHRAILFEQRKQLTLEGNIRKEFKGRLSFFKRLSVSKGNIAAQWEDAIFAIRK